MQQAAAWDRGAGSSLWSARSSRQPARVMLILKVRVTGKRAGKSCLGHEAYPKG